MVTIELYTDRFYFLDDTTGEDPDKLAVELLSGLRGKELTQFLNRLEHLENGVYEIEYQIHENPFDYNLNRLSYGITVKNFIPINRKKPNEIIGLDKGICDLIEKREKQKKGEKKNEKSRMDEGGHRRKRGKMEILFFGERRNSSIPD